jgi:hypothetical protein
MVFTNRKEQLSEQTSLHKKVSCWEDDVTVVRDGDGVDEIYQIKEQGHGTSTIIVTAAAATAAVDAAWQSRERIENI